MLHKVLVVGPPGTGKTEFAKSLVADAIKKGVHPSQILFTSFTRAAAYEGRERCMAVFPQYTDSDFPFFRTLHSIGFRLLRLNRNSIFDGHKLKEFAKTFNYRFSADTLDKDIFQQEIIDMGLGTEVDAYLAFDEWRKNKLYFSLDLMGLDFKQAYNEFIREHGELHSQFNEKSLRAFIERKDAYKQQEGLWEFSDILAKVLMDEIPLDVDVVIADEHQDASPLLHAVIELWSRNAKEVYLLGDPDQCLPAGTKITTPDGEANIESLSEGSAVVVSIGSGYSDISRVFKVHRNISPKLFITLSTKTGKELTLTADHRLFAYVPFSYTQRPGKEICGGQIRITHTAMGNQGKVKAGLLMTAGNIMRGFLVPILSDGRVIMDEVIDVKREFRIEETYDLDVEQYHNYFANGIMVHNCIYSWMSADPSIMIDWERDEDIVLKQSHRCSQAVHDLSRKITDRMKVRYHSDFIPTNSEGEVIRTSTPNYDSAGSTIVCARTRYLLERHYDELLRLGIPFTARRGEKSPLDRKEREVVLTLYYLMNGEQVSFDNIYRLSEVVPQKRWLEYGAKSNIKEMAAEEPSRKLSKASLPALGFTSDFMSVLNDREFLTPLKLEERDKLYFRRIINKYGIGGLIEQPKLSLGTIHSFKGLEADRVLLDLELTTRPLENLDINPDSEHRVMYVGCTRSREEIQLLVPASWRSYSLW